MRRPILHVSGRLPRERGYVGLLLPLLRQPGNANGVICFDLMGDAEALLRLDADAIREQVFTPAADLAEGSARLPLKTIHLNRCPIVLTPRLLDRATAARLHIDLVRCERHWRLLAAAEVAPKLAQVFAPRPPPSGPVDADTALYAGFLADDERPLLAAARAATTAAELDPARIPFRDPRYRELLFRQRARRFREPDRAGARKLAGAVPLAAHRSRLRYLGMAAYRAELERLGAEAADPGKRALLAALADWGTRVAAELELAAG